ncbi:MAG TPA: DUF2325 domain-containing protein [Burkholderiaceae bacterium]|nr:DUF2325 domain-containing protein [Burkholderiaceae bacterium]
MHAPPFKLAATALVTRDRHAISDRAPPPAQREGGATAGLARARLAQLDPHFYCSIIGTCLGTAELRRLVGRHAQADEDRATDLEIHHVAVRLAHEGGAVAKELNKALERRHEAAIQHFSTAEDPVALLKLWDEACCKGEIPGAYWAVLTHRQATKDVRDRAFGDVHMLSHLVGASNVADLRRLAALQEENGNLREQLARQLARQRALAEERDQAVQRLDEEVAAGALRLAAKQAVLDQERAGRPRDDEAARRRQVALQTERRERAESTAQDAIAEVERLRERLQRMQQHADILARELAAAEATLVAGDGEARGRGAGQTDADALVAALRGRRIVYVGGRPSSAPMIRALVERHGGEFLRHDGGLEDRKGLLAAAISGADLVAFPVDCIDHDSALNLKRLCGRHDVPFLALRTASVASFAAGVADQARAGRDAGGGGACGACPKHG